MYNPIKFIHLRFWGEDEQPLAHGGITIAYRDDPDHPDRLHVSFSRCHTRDHYNKHIGRQITIGRLSTEQYYNIARTHESPAEVVSQFVLNKVYTEDNNADVQTQTPEEEAA